MTNFTSSERRGTILLTLIIAIAVAATILWTALRQPQSDATQPTVIETIGSDSADSTSVTTADRKRAKKSRTKTSSRKKAPAGRQRDYLDEPL